MDVLTHSKGGFMIYAGLLLSVPTPEIPMEEVPFTNGYSRIVLPEKAWKMNGSRLSYINTKTIKFPKPSKVWGNVFGVGLFNDEKSKALLCSLKLIYPVLVKKDAPTFEKGEFRIPVHVFEDLFNSL